MAIYDSAFVIQILTGVGVGVVLLSEKIQNTESDTKIEGYNVILIDNLKIFCLNIYRKTLWL